MIDAGFFCASLEAMVNVQCIRPQWSVVWGTGNAVNLPGSEPKDYLWSKRSPGDLRIGSDDEHDMIAQSNRLRCTMMGRLCSIPLLAKCRPPNLCMTPTWLLPLARCSCQLSILDQACLPHLPHSLGGYGRCIRRRGTTGLNRWHLDSNVVSMNNLVRTFALPL
jgi:hypothetical protein